MVTPRTEQLTAIISQKKLYYVAMCLWIDGRLEAELASGFLCASLFSLASQLGGQGAGANWGKAGVLMWNLIEMCRSKVSSGAEHWLCSVLNDCSQQCLSASSLQADNHTASTTAWQTWKKVTPPLHHLHCVKYHYIRQGQMKTLTWAFE